MISTEAKEYSFNFGREKIKIFLSFKERKNLKICVHPDKTVTVYAPKGKKISEVLKRIKERGPWIIRQKDYFERFQPLITPRQYVSGECHYYLGRQYRLKVYKNKESDVKLVGKFIKIYTPEVSAHAEIKELLYKWYAKHALSIFNRRIALHRNVIKKLNVGYPELKIRQMKKRWGSCGKSGSIVLNTELIKAPLFCIDYVIMHEICHLRNRSHDYKFYKLLEKHMPDWKLRKERLERVII